jgi:hypothetical protein
MTRFATSLLFLSACAAPLQAQDESKRYEPPARFQEYATAVIDPISWGNVAASTLLDQIGDNPESWGFTDRALSNASRFLLEETIYHGVAALQDRSTWYHPCECTDWPSRSGHAFAQAFTDYDRAGVSHVSAARIGAPYGAAIAEALWRPDTSIFDAIKTGSSSLVFTGLFNIVREFVR